jgi:hypothetical protein
MRTPKHRPSSIVLREGITTDYRPRQFRVLALLEAAILKRRYPAREIDVERSSRG